MQWFAIGHVDVQSCLLIIFQYQPITLQYSWLSVEQPIRFSLTASLRISNTIEASTELIEFCNERVWFYGVVPPVILRRQLLSCNAYLCISSQIFCQVKISTTDNRSWRYGLMKQWVFTCYSVAHCCCFQWEKGEKTSELSEYKRQAPMVLTFPGK